MANLPNFENAAWPEVYQFEVNDPIAGGPDGIDNLPHRQLAERTDFLKARLATAQGDLDTIDDRLQVVEASDVGAFGRAVPLAWGYSDQGFAFELFATGAVWRDMDPVDVVETIAGDESVDVVSTADLQPGATYVISNGGVTLETVVVDRILTPRRFRAAAPLSVSLAGGKLGRSSWDIRAGYAIARDGDLFYSRPLDVLRFHAVGRLVIRRDTGSGVLTVAYRATGGGPWTPAILTSTAQRVDGARDEEYAIGIGGIIDVRVACAAGPTDGSVRIDHMVVFTPPRAGYEPVATPVNVGPADGATAIGERPTLSASPFRSLYGVAQATAQFRVTRDPSGATIVHDSGALGAVQSYAVPGGALTANSSYFWQARYKDADGVWSAWSTPTGFSTGAVFAYVARPMNIAPGDGSTSASTAPALQASAFSAAGGPDSHIASQWQVSVAPHFAALIHDSGETAMGLTSQHVPAGMLGGQQTYYWRVRYKGAALGWSEWSAPTSFTTLAMPAAPTNTSPAAGATGVSLPPTLTSSGFFVPGGSDSHVASQWQVAATAAFASIVHDSGDSASLTSYAIPSAAGLAGVTTYYWRVRHKGAATGYGDWSAPTSFQTAPPSGAAAFTTPGSYDWTVPAGVTSVCAVCVGGGGGAKNTGGGGAGGGLGWKNNITVVPGSTVTVTVGSGGVGGTTGSAGGTSSFGAHVSASGGGGTYGGPGAPIGADGGGSGGYPGTGGGGAGGYTGAGGNGAEHAGLTSHTIRVDLDKIDRLVNMVGEMVITQAMIAEHVRELPQGEFQELLEGLEQLAQHTRELRESVMSIRAQPVSSVFSRMPRLVRECSAATGKEVQLVTSGETTEVDKTVVENLVDPLTHMIRNSIDHGLEGPEERERIGKPRAGTVHLSAQHRSGRIVIEITDDGRGINRPKVLSKAIEKGLVQPGASLSDEEIDNLIFLPGFSTADQVSNLSGRGVGMDVVRRNITSLGGRIGVYSTPGEGSRFVLSLPLTLAVLDGMVISVGEERFVLPLTNIVESLRPKPADLHGLVGKCDVMMARGEYVRLVYLHQLFGIPKAATDPTRALVVLVETEDGARLGLVVDEVLGQQQVVIKSLEANFRRLDGVAAATILGDGRVALILDVAGLREMSRHHESGSKRPPPVAALPAPALEPV